MRGQPNFTQLAHDIIEIEFGIDHAFDAMKIMSKVNQRWGLGTDWHDFTFPLEALERDGRIYRWKPGEYPGMSQYRRTITEITNEMLMNQMTAYVTKQALRGMR